MSKRYTVYLLFLITLLFGCVSDNKSNKNKINNKEQDTDFSINNKSNKLGESKSFCPPYKGLLPFGCQKLLELPDSINCDIENIENNTSYHDFNDVEQFYRGLIKKDVINIPQIKSSESINLGKYYPFPLPVFTDSIRYKLPDFGPYQCFYSQNDLLIVKSQEIDKSIALEHPDWLESTIIYDYGNLILYDPLLKKAKVINIYYTVGSSDEEIESLHGYDRLFFIGKDQVIKVYKIEYSGFHEVIYPKIDFSIKVSKEGDIVVTNPLGEIIKTYER